MGRGETFTVSLQQGSRARNYQVGFSEPFLFDRPITLGTELHRQQIRYPYTYTQNNTGGSLTFGFAVRSFSRAFTTYSYEQINIEDLNEAFLGPPTITPDNPEYAVPPLGYAPTDPTTPGTGNPFYDDMLLLGSGGKRTVSKITPSFVHNTVDNPIFPSAGRRFTASVDLAGPGGNTRFIKPTIEGVYYRPLNRRMTVGARGQFIYITAVGDKTILPIFERLFLGGEYSVRGFDIRTIGPRDPLTGYVIGGNTSILFNAEYLIQIAGPVRLVFFYDAGQVLLKQQNPSFDKFKTSTGAEIRFFMPVLNVPFRLIAAWNPQRDGMLRQPVAAPEGVHVQVRRGLDVLGGREFRGPSGIPVIAVVTQRKGTGRMKALTVAVLAGCVLVAGVAYAQQPPVQQTPPPAQQTPPPAQQQPPAVPPAAAPQAAPAPAAKFPEGAKYAFINIQRIASESAEGKSSSSRIEALRAKKASELTEKNKLVEALQAKQRSAVMSESASAQVQKDIDKAQVDIQRMTQDAQSELQDLQNELQLDFQRKVGPVIEAVAREKGLQLLFSQADSGLVWADGGLDLTAEVIRRLDAASAAAPKPAPAAPKK